MKPRISCTGTRVGCAHNILNIELANALLIGLCEGVYDIQIQWCAHNILNIEQVDWVG